MIHAMLARFWQALPAGMALILGHVVSIATGLLIALALYFVLFRISLPGTPFIYVVF